MRISLLYFGCQWVLDHLIVNWISVSAWLTLSLWLRVNPQNESIRNSLQWTISVINPVDNIKLSHDAINNWLKWGQRFCRLMVEYSYFSLCTCAMYVYMYLPLSTRYLFLDQGQVLSKGFNVYTDTNSSDRRKLLSSFPKYCNPWTIQFRPWANVVFFFFFFFFLFVISSFCLSTQLSENVKKIHVF